MVELLAPAGTMEALKAAVNCGCDAIYLGMTKFGARAYATNFDSETIKEAIEYCHLNNVKIYVTMNTIVFEDELEAAYAQIKELYELGIDAIIIQDIALLDYVKTHCPDMEAHASTQMGLDDSYGVLEAKGFGADRVVLGRECSIATVKKVKEETKVPVEVFAHGAHCVSYSGNCLMSGLIGYRSGNRGRCVGSCRKPYELINTTTNESLGTSYILSMKDLATIESIDDLSFVDSLKIEGRMKEPSYVANVISHYRNAIDNGVASKDAMANLEKTFHRSFTKGYLFGVDKKDVTNIKKPNHLGYYVGKISNVKGKCYEISLIKEINQNDVISIDSKEEITYPLTKMFDANNNFIRSANKKCYIYMDDKANVGDKVYVVKDTNYLVSLDEYAKILHRRVKVSFYLELVIGKPIKLTAISGYNSYSLESDFIVEESKKEVVYENVFKQLNRLNDTVYEIENLEINGDKFAFAPASKLNELRRNVIDGLNNERLVINRKFNDENLDEIIDVKLSDRALSVFCTTKEQYEVANEIGIKNIYFDNYIRRNEAEYKDDLDVVLVGGYGGINYYKNKNNYLVSDFSLNAVNSRSLYLLHKEGVNRITLSHELNKQNIIDMISEFEGKYNTKPNLEMIVYGHAHLMNTKYCPLKVNGLCGKCRTNQYVIKDNYGEFPIISHQNCMTTIVNGRPLNLLDEINFLPEAITTFRLQFTVETKEETRKIILKALEKFNGSSEKLFDSNTQTRGHFNKEIM